MLEAKSLAALQAFAREVRQPYPASSDPRLAVYQRLFINNVRSMLASSFPITHRLLGEPIWGALIAQFYAHHRARTPRFTELALEFIDFVATPEYSLGLPYPVNAIAELLHYEWIETELMLSDAPTPISTAPKICISPLARALAYSYPVHTLSLANPPCLTAPEVPTFLLLWRSVDFAVRFQVLTPQAMQLLIGFQNGAAAPHKGADLAPEALELIARWQHDGVLI